MSDTLTLEQRRDAVLAQLNDPEFAGDLDALNTEARQLVTDIEARNERQLRATEARAALMGVNVTPAPAPVTPTSIPAQRTEAPAQTRMTTGEAFLGSDALREFRNANGRGTASFEIPGMDLRAVIDNSATSGGAFQNPARPADVPYLFNDRAPRVLDLLDRRQTDSNTVEYVQDTTALGGGVAAETAEGAAKPESTYTFVVVVEPVRTIAHWTNLTRQTVDDNAQLRGYVEGRLSYGLEYRADQQAINGNGTAPNLRGILNVAGINTYAPAAAEAKVISIRKAITLCQNAEYYPSGVVLNPADWEAVELSTDTQGMFRVSPNVSNALAPRIWGLNVVPTTVIAAGTGLVGDFRMGATWWQRQGVTIHLSDSHASNFTSNLLTLLAEMRAALAVWRPKAFCRITFNGTA